MQVDAQGRDVERTRVMATLGDLSGATDGVATPPQLPDPMDCLGSDDLPRALVEETELMERYEVRLDPATSGGCTGSRPRLGRLRIALSSVDLAGGLIEEDAEIWDSSDRLVAQARQLAKVLRGLATKGERLSD